MRAWSRLRSMACSWSSKSGKQKPSALQSAFEKLELVNGQLLGVILNGTEPDTAANRYVRRRKSPAGERNVAAAAVGCTRTTAFTPRPGITAWRQSDPVTARAAERAFLLPAAGLGMALGWAATQAPLVLLGTTAATVVGAIALMHAEVLLLLLVAAMPWEGALAWPSEQVSVVKLLGLLLFTAWIVRGLITREPVHLDGALVPALIVGVTVLLAFAFSPDPEAGKLDVVRFALFIAFFFLIIQMVRTRREVQRIVQVVVLSGSVAALWGLYAFIVLNRDRAGGPIDDPNDFAYLLACLLPLAAYLISAERARRGLWAACFVALAACTLATLSRGALVGLVALIAWGLVTRRIPLAAVAAGFVAVASVAALAFAIWAPEIHHKLQSKEQIASSNVESRRAFWSGAVRMSAEPPDHGSRTRALRRGSGDVRAKRSARHQQPARAQLLSAGARGDRRARPRRLSRIPRDDVASPQSRACSGT